MNEKYIEERYPRWFIFGKSAEGLVDVSNGNQDVITNVTEAQANELIAERNKLIDALVECAQGFDESNPGGFKVYWYVLSNPINNET